MTTNPDKKFSLANKSHLEAFLGLLMATGAMCPKCGFGTRKTSKNWRRCKRCNERVPVRALLEADKPET